MFDLGVICPQSIAPVASRWAVQIGSYVFFFLAGIVFFHGHLFCVIKYTTYHLTGFLCHLDIHFIQWSLLSFMYLSGWWLMDNQILQDAEKTKKWKIKFKSHSQKLNKGLLIFCFYFSGKWSCCSLFMFLCLLQTREHLFGLGYFFISQISVRKRKHCF